MPVVSFDGDVLFSFWDRQNLDQVLTQMKRGAEKKRASHSVLVWLPVDCLSIESRLLALA